MNVRQFMLLSLLFATIVGCKQFKTGRQGPVEISKKAPASQESRGMWSIETEGAAYRLNFQGTMLTFCDKRGQRGLDLVSGEQRGTGQGCTPENVDADTNSGCQWPGVSSDVRYSFSEPNDTVDVGTSVFPLKGRVQDCAHQGNVVAVVTVEQAMLLDGATGRRVQIDAHEADRVAIGSGWVAWTTADQKHLKALQQTTAWTTLPVVAPGV